MPHEVEEDRTVYPMLAAAAGSDEMTAALHHTHTEIFRLIRLFDRLVRDLPEDAPTADDRTDLRRLLYGLDAILRLHMAQEEELYASLGDDRRSARMPVGGDRAERVEPATRRRSRARIAASSAGSAWSQPQMWSVPWVTRSRSSSAGDQRTSPVWPPRPASACSMARSTETTMSPRCGRRPGRQRERGRRIRAGTRARRSGRSCPCGSR